VLERAKKEEEQGDQGSGDQGSGEGERAGEDEAERQAKALAALRKISNMLQVNIT
jgi:hypothetical protein